MKNKIKKSLSLIMAVLMVLSCWVWVAPTEAEAAAGNYYVEVIWSANRTGSSTAPDFDADNNSSSQIGFKFDWVGDNGLNKELTGSYVYNCSGGATNVNNTANFTLNGFPTKLYVQDDWGTIGQTCQLEIKTIKVGVDSSNLKTIFNGVITMKSSTDSKVFTIDYTGATTSNDTDNAYISTANTAKWELPKPTSISGLGGTTNITIPDINNPNEVVENKFTAKAYDQYGVEWYNTPSYYLSQAKDSAGSDMSNEASGLWWVPNSNFTTATVKVNSVMQTVYSVPLKEGNTRDYYLVAQMSEADGVATASQTLHFTYPKYNWYFNGEVQGLMDGKVSIMIEDKSGEETVTYPWDSNNDGIPDAIIDAKGYLAYNQSSTLVPIGAEKEGFTFYGFWTVPQTPAPGQKGDPFSKEANFAEPVDSDTYNSLPADEKELYCDAGEQWNYRTNAVTTNNKAYYAWWLSDDVSVKFYDVDGSYLDSFDVKAGNKHSAFTWPTPTEEHQDGYTNGAFTYTNWTGKWVNIDGEVVDPKNYEFKKDLILTPEYESATFDKTHRVNFYDVNGNIISAHTKDYNYRDVATVPTENEAGQVDPYATAKDYTYTFEGWSSQTPSTGSRYHVMLEDADYDVNTNYIALAGDFIVRSDVTYYPVYRRHAIGYNVSFRYRDESATQVTLTVPYKYGQIIEIPEEVPATYARYGVEYSIIGWTKGGTAVTIGEETCSGAATYLAQYDAGKEVPYNITFEYVNDNNEVVSTVAEVSHGFKIGQAVVDALVVNDTYDDGTQELYFNGTWACSNGATYATADLANVGPTSHLTFTAVYEDGVPFRTVTYVDGETTKDFRITSGTKLPYWTYDVNSEAGTVTETYVPSKEKTEFGTYTFAGWFDEEQADETKTNGNQYIPGETEITADVTLYPQFTYELYNYNFVFKNYDGTVLEEGTFHLGDSLTQITLQAEREAVRAADETYTYQFLGWDKRVPEKCEGGEPDSTLTFIAQYKPIYIYYNAEWYNDEASMNDGETLPVATSKYVYGDRMHTPSVTLTPPANAPAGQNYVFAGWYYKDANGDAQPFVRNMTITGDMKFYATYALTAKTWNVTVNDGTNTYTLTVEDGSSIKDLVSDPIAGYVDADTHRGFVNWTSNGNVFNIETATITADIEIVANFEVGKHVYNKSEIVTLPTYPMASYTDYDGTVVPATTGEGLKRFWCECDEAKTEKKDIEGCIIPALKDEVKPGSTTYIGTANWSDFSAAAGANVVYANPNTDFIITTSDKGDVDSDYNATGKGIGVQSIAIAVAPAEKAYATEDELALNSSLVTWQGIYDWTQIQALLIENYGGWDKVPDMYKDYNANYTAELSSYNLTDGEKYVVYAKVTDKANNISYMRTAEFTYDATKPVVEVTGNYNEAANTYCEQAVITVTEATSYTVAVDGTPVNETTADNKYNIGEGVHQIVVTDKAGNKTSVFFTVLKEHTLVNYNEAATCITAGFTSKRCINCSADFEREDVEPLGHDNETVLVPATCTENGYTVTTCSRCDMEPERNEYTSDGELIEAAKGHAWNAGVVVKAATCKTQGVKIFTCTVCGATEQTTIPAEDGAHNFYKPQIVKPTCTDAGQVTQLCRACGETVVIYQGADDTAANYNAEYAPKGHTADKWIVSEAARCYARGTDAAGKEYFGVETNVCSVCDAVITGENGEAVTRYIYEAVPHTWVVDQRIEPTVDEAGKITYKCAVDGCPATKPATILDKLEQFTVTFIGTTVEEVTDDEGKKSSVEKETKTEYKDLPGVTVDGALIPEQKKLNSADGKVAYVFDGWYTKKADGSFDKKYTLPMEITENITLYAQFKAKDVFYTVDFEIPSTYTPATETVKESYGGYKEFKSLMGAIGDERTPGEVPTFAETDYFTFEFDGWYTKGTNPTKYDGKISGDETYQAAFKAEAKTYTVIFMSDGVVFDTEEVTAGAAAVPSEGTPTKASDADYHYSFKGWYTSTDGRTAADLTDITEKTTVYAVYNEAEHDKGESGTVKQEANCTLAEITEYTCADCGYEWTEITAEAEDHTPGAPVYNEETGKNEIRCTVCKELISEADASYTIKFEDHNGRRLDTITVKVNNKFIEQAEAAAELASKASDDKNDYKFAGWIVNEGDTPVASKDLPAATANVTYIAAYTATARTFSVTYATSTLVTGESVAKKTYSGIAYGTIKDKDGNDVTAYAFDADVFGIPKSDAKVHYVFTGWDADFSKGVTSNMLVRPMYDAIDHDFDKNNDGVVNTADAVASEATCTESGGYKYTCEDCGYYYITGNIAAQGHNYVTKTVKEPTFKEEGLAVKTCQRCGDTIEEVIPVKEYIVVKVAVKDTDGKAYYGAKVEITHDQTGKVYGPNLTDTSGVATFYVEQSGEYFVRVLEIPGHEGGYSGDITVNENGDITSSTLPTLEGESSKACSCGCHRNNFWGMLFRFFHNIIKLFAGRYICCDCPDSRY